MKSCLPLLVILVVTLLYTAENANARELCQQENCLAPEKCEDLVVGAGCLQKDTTCCSIVKSEHRTHCRHHGGECMSKCHSSLRRDAVDCEGGTVCCVLV